jgi:lauroyl/myristoyl acyltransferase
MDPNSTSQLATDLFSDSSFERWSSRTAEERLDNSKKLITVHGVYFVSEFFLLLVKKLRYWFEYIGVGAVLRIVPLLAIGLVRLLADGAGWLVYHLDRKNRRVALANLEAAFGDKFTAKERERIARRSVQVFGRSFLELFWTPRLTASNVGKYITIEDEELLQSILSTKASRPVVGVTIHFGNFEWASAYYALRGYTGLILMQRFKNDRLTSLFQRLRETSGQTSVTQENSMVRFFKALKRGVPVGILIDLTLKMSDPAVIFRTFGLPMRATMMHAVLHDRTRAPIMPFVALPRKGGGYLIRAFEPIQFPAKTPYHKIAQACWDKFEPLIREHPEQWLWGYKHWRYRPANPEKAHPFYANQSELFDAEFEKINAN